MSVPRRSPAARLAPAAILAFAASSALADPAPLASSLTGAAKSDWEAGKLLYADHDYRGAATKFRAAYDASHDARLLWNVATCEKEQRHYAKAESLVERYLAEGASVLTAEQVAQARAVEGVLRGFFSPVQLDVRPAGA